MKTSHRPIALTVALFATGLLLAGCASAPADPETSTPTTSDLEVNAAWLDDGRAVAVITQGSSTCVPIAVDVKADGQTVTVELDQGDATTVCTADLVARATLVTLPKGVDPKADVKLKVSLGSAQGDTELDGNSALAGLPGEPTDYLPSAGWFDDSSLVLLTWGSSTCLPVIDSVEASGRTGTITFVTEDRVCTMDMGPRTTLVEFGDLDEDADDSFVLTLVGDHLDATVKVLRG